MTNKEQSLKTLLIVDFLAFGAMIFINFLGASGFFNGMSQAAISDHYPTLITPAGFTFSIWGIIYSLLIYTTFTQHQQILNTQTPFGSIFTLFVIFKNNSVASIELHSNQMWKELAEFYKLVGLFDKILKLK